MNPSRSKIAAFAAIALSIVIVASVGYEATMTKSVSQTSSVDNETTKSPASTASTSSQTYGTFAATESNPTNGLQLIVTVEPTDVVPGQNVTINVSVYTNLARTNNFTFAPGEADSLTTLSLYYGRFTRSNISVAGPYVRFFQRPTGCPCNIEDNPSEYAFAPHQGMSQTIIVGGYWLGSDGNPSFNLFLAGTYTFEAYDIWGQITPGYFTVSD
jgi:hypothetical protein